MAARRVGAATSVAKMGAARAVGDQANDLEMLRDAGLGIAMGDAPPDVIAVADEVTGTVAADGVAEAIERHILSAVVR